MAIVWKGAPLLRKIESTPKTLDFADQQIAAAVRRGQRKEEYSAFNFKTTIAGHLAIDRTALVGTARCAFAHPTTKAPSPRVRGEVNN